MKHFTFWKIVFLFVWAAIPFRDLSAETEFVSVKTKAENNPLVSVWFRVPQNYNPRNTCRVLVIFGGRNSNGKNEAAGAWGWAEWADQHNVFLVSPGFKDDSYWEPQQWSGRALLQALNQISKRYNICTSKVFFYGYSAGSQCANLFAAWRPDMTRAWVSHACGVFHEPSTRMRGVPGLVTCGDADQTRYIISRNFVEAARRKGADIIWKSFPNHPHDVPPDSLKLARAFLSYYHLRYRTDLENRPAGRADTIRPAYIGDDQENIFYPADAPAAANILPEDRVPLPNRFIADAWGRAAL